MHFDDLALFKREKQNIGIDLIKSTMSKVERPSWKSLKIASLLYG